MCIRIQQWRIKNVLQFKSAIVSSHVQVLHYLSHPHLLMYTKSVNLCACSCKAWVEKREYCAVELRNFSNSKRMDLPRGDFQDYVHPESEFCIAHNRGRQLWLWRSLPVCENFLWGNKLCKSIASRCHLWYGLLCPNWMQALRVEGIVSRGDRLQSQVGAVVLRRLYVS